MAAIYTDSGLRSGTIHKYKVFVKYMFGSSAPSNVASATAP